MYIVTRRSSFLAVSLVVLVLAALTGGVALAHSSTQMDMGTQQPTDMQMDMGNQQPADTQMDMGMSMGAGDSWQDNINRIAYPITAILAIVTTYLCIRLIRLTGLVDKFALISAGLALFLIQAVLGVLFYMTDGDAISMPNLMFAMSVFTSIALLLISGAFFQWIRMIR